jgi:hypothetical protein
MCKTDGSEICDSLRIIFLGYKHNKSLIQEVQALMIEVVKLLHCPKQILFDGVSTSCEEAPYVAI